MKLLIVPCKLDEANAFVKQHHRHHGPVIGHIFSIAVADESMNIRGVAIVGRPVSRKLDNGWRLEITRCCTDGCHNACSALYAACWRTVRAMGYTELITYILDTETGQSLTAAGWKCVGKTTGGTWNRESRPRVDKHPTQGKLRFAINRELGGEGAEGEVKADE